MTTIDKSIYPTIPNDLPQKLVKQHYNLSIDEIAFTVNKTLNINNQVCFAILFKTYQKLGYFIDIHQCPRNIVAYISLSLNADAPLEYDLFCYDKNRIKDKHMANIRQYFKCKITTSKIILDVATKIASTKSSLLDIINGTIETLLAELYELPKFFALENICTKARRSVNTSYYELIYKRVSEKNKKYIKNNILIYSSNGESYWSLLKQEPPKISIVSIRSFSKHLAWLRNATIAPKIFGDVPQVKLDSLFEEGYSYDFYKIKRLKQEKKIALVALVIHHQLLSATDDLIFMLIKYMSDMEQDAKNDLLEYKMTKLESAELLISKFKDVLSEYRKTKSTAKLKSMTALELDNLIKLCNEYNA